MKKQAFLDILATSKEEARGEDREDREGEILRPEGSPAPSLRPLSAQEEAEIRATFEQSRAENTDRTYAVLVRRFEKEAVRLGWDGKLPLDVAVLIRTFNSLAKNLTFASLRVLVAALHTAHETIDRPSPTRDPSFVLYMKGLRRQRTKIPKKAYFFEPDDLFKAWEGLCEEDRMVLYTAVYTGLRREALCSIEVKNIEIQAEGLAISIVRDKQIKGKPHLAFLPAVLPRFSELKAFVQAAKDAGQVYLFPPRISCKKSVHLNARTFCRLVKRAAKLCGKEDACTRYSGHSTRRGLGKALAKKGERIERISQILGHTDPKTTLGYLKEHEITNDSPLLRLIEKENER